MRIIFMGTPDFAVPCLQRLNSDGHDVALVVTQPDKPKGRGFLMSQSAVKICAVEQDIPVYQPEKVKNNPDCVKKLAEMNADIIVVVAYGKILPSEILALTKYGCINVHASLLPEYRGAAPINWAIVNGEKRSGVTIMQMDEGMDTGDMLLQCETTITENMTAGELFSVLSESGAETLSQVILQTESGGPKPTKQNHDEATYAPMLTKKHGVIDFGKSAFSIHNQIRGLDPWPGATAVFREKMLKIHASKIDAETDADGYNEEPGTVVRRNPLTVVCGDQKAIVLKKVQLAGKKALLASDFVNGQQVKVSERLK